jgi:hypothetical protein
LAEDAPHPRIRQYQTGAGALDHPGSAVQVLVQAPQADRRIERDRDGAGKEDSEEGLEELDPGREDQGDAVTAFDA